MIKATFVINFKDKKPVKSLAAILLFALYAATTFSQSNVQAKCMINVKVDKPIANIQSTMWGIFFEDINMGADGGIYAELVKNRSFEFYKPLNLPEQENSIESPNAINPIGQSTEMKGEEINITVKPNSLTVIRQV